MLNANESTEEEVRETGLRFRVFFPPGFEAKKADIVLLVHGRAGNDRVMWTFSKLLENLNAIVIAPQAPHADPQGGWSWWIVDGDVEPADVSPEKLFAATGVLSDFISRFCHMHNLTPTAVTGIGFSQGAAVISALGITEPSTFSAMALLAGFVPHVALEKALLNEPTLQAAKPRVFVAHGSADEIVPIEVAESGRAVLKSLGFEGEMVSVSVGHKVGVNAQRSLRYWLEKIR